MVISTSIPVFNAHAQLIVILNMFVLFIILPVPYHPIDLQTYLSGVDMKRFSTEQHMQIILPIVLQPV